VKQLKLAAAAALAAAMGLSACADTSDPFSPSVPVSFNASVSSASGADAEFVAGQVLVRFRPGAARNEIAEQNRARPKEETRLERLWVLEVEAGEELEIANNLARNPNVEFAEPNWLLQVVPCGTGDCETVNDFHFGRKWDLYNSGVITDNLGNSLGVTGMARADISWIEGRTQLEANGGVTGTARVAILDTGIRGTHQDLANKVVANRNFVCSNLILGICFGSVNANAWQDTHGHGTHVAGIAAAHGNNGGGVPGVAYSANVQLVNARVCSASGCPTDAIVNGINWAVSQGAQVLNLSLGGGAAQASIQAALRNAVNNNVLPICASGNDGRGTVSWPAAFPECMAVGSTSWSDTRASYSNWGPEVEISAPGGDVGGIALILSAGHQNDAAYVYMAGTSMATPQVAGLAGLLRATGMTSAEAIRTRLKATADDLGVEGRDNEFGHGRINVYRAITQMNAAIPVTISTRSTINRGSNGNMQVVMLGRDAVTYSLSSVQVQSVQLSGVPIARRTNGTPFAVWSDVDGDGVLDLVMHFSVPALRNGLSPSTTHVILEGGIQDGRSIRGAVEVTVQ
jgi:subtilisin family serine protease